MCALLMLLLSVLRPPTGADAEKVLVLMDSPSVRETHSAYFELLQDQGFQLTFGMADDPNTQLSRYGELLYQHVIVFAPATVEFGGGAYTAELLNYVDDGGNLLVAGQPNLGYSVADLVSRCGFEFDSANTSVIDHFHNDVDRDVLSSLITVNPSDHPGIADIFGVNDMPPILYRGIGLRMADANPLTIPLVRSYATAYSGNPQSLAQSISGVTGRSIVLVGLMQARNNARVVVTGSLEMFSDDLMEADVALPELGDAKTRTKSGNKELALLLSHWVFQQINVIRVKSVRHHKVGESQSPKDYTIMDMLQFTIELEHKVNDKWLPYVADDVQLEFVRIDPFIRVTMNGNERGVYTTTFQVPDVCGVYKLMVKYNKLGWTRLYNVTQVSVRPFQHTQYERFIRSAYPYYASAMSMMVCVLLFTCVFLYHKETTMDKKED